MATTANEISVRMKLRKATVETLENVIANPSVSDVEKRVAQEYLEKMVEKSVTSDLTVEEEERLTAAENKLEERLARRKTPSKTDKKMAKLKEGAQEEVVDSIKPLKRASSHATVRESLNQSREVPSLAVGATVAFDDRTGVVARIYCSKDGKEKCIIHPNGEDSRPVKKRVTAVCIVTE